MTDKKDDEDFKIEISDEVLEQMAQDSGIARAIEEFKAKVDQANEMVRSGEVADFHEAMERLGARELTEEESDKLLKGYRDEKNTRH